MIQLPVAVTSSCNVRVYAMVYRTIEEIFAHNEDWIAEKLATDSEYFRKLSEQQSPQYLFIGCSDSRITSEAVMYAEPGAVFVHRNVANLIQIDDLNVLSVVDYAVNHLKVKHIIVCGHYGCGGITAALDTADAGVLNPWLSHIRDVYRLHKAELNAIQSTGARQDRLVELNVIEQCINLLKIFDVQNALAKGEVQIHGWVFDMRTGRLKDLKFDTGKVKQEVIEIYNITRPTEPSAR